MTQIARHNMRGYKTTPSAGMHPDPVAGHSCKSNHQLEKSWEAFKASNLDRPTGSKAQSHDGLPCDHRGCRAHQSHDKLALHDPVTIWSRLAPKTAHDVPCGAKRSKQVGKEAREGPPLHVRTHCKGERDGDHKRGPKRDAGYAVSNAPTHNTGKIQYSLLCYSVT